VEPDFFDSIDAIFKSLIKTSNDFVFVLDSKGKFRFANAKATETFGNLICKSGIRHISSEYHAAAKKNFKRILKNEKVEFHAIEVLSKGGKRFWVEISGSPLVKDGKVIGALYFEKDINERKEAEDALRESEERYRLLINNSINPIWVIDCDGIIKIVNLAGAKPLGGTPEDFIGKSLTEILPDDAERLLERNNKIIETGEGANFEDVFDLPSGKMWVWYNIQPVRGKEGNISGVQSIAYDITERKEAEEKIKKVNLELSDILESINDGFLVLDNTLGIKQFNKVAEKILGREKDEVIGQQLFEAFPEAKGSVFEKNYTIAVQEKKPLAFEAYFGIVPYEGWYDVRVSPYKNGISVHFDLITERKNAEEALRESEEKFRGLAEKSPNMIFINTKGRVTFANEKCEEIMGYTLEEFYAPDFNFIALIVPEHRKLIMQKFKMHMVGEDVEPYDYTLVAKDGGRIDVIQTTRLIQSGGETAILGMLTDITKRKKAEEAMKWQLMKFSIKKGNSYLVKETKPIISRDAYIDIIKCGFSGTILSRRRSEDIKKLFGKETEVFWIAEKAGEKIIAPDLEEIKSLIEKLPPGNNVVFLDRLDYLIVTNGFENTLRFIQNLTELFYINRWILLIALDITTIDKRELRLLENETNTVISRQSVDLDEDIYEILKYVYNEEKKGRKPAYGDVGVKCGITKQTTRKRIEILKRVGYLIDKKKGRHKILEMTEKGKYLF